MSEFLPEEIERWLFGLGWSEGGNGRTWNKGNVTFSASALMEALKNRNEIDIKTVKRILKRFK